MECLYNWEFCYYIIIFVTILIIFFSNNKEHFIWNHLSTGNVSRDCYKLNKNQCLKYENCGLCLDNNNNISCQPGDYNGAFFKDDCKLWKHNNFDKIFNENVKKTYKPWNIFQFDYNYPLPMSKMWPSPKSWSTL